MPAIRKQPAANRDREGGFNKQNESAVIVTKSNETIAERKRVETPKPVVVEKRKAGRPKGSTDKAKGLIPTELADKFLDSVRPLLPPEHYEEMKAAVKGGKSISTVNEAKIMLKLMGPSLMRRLIDEYGLDEVMDADLAAELGPRESEFKKDTNERLKVWMDLLKIVRGIEEKEDAASGHSQKKPLLEIIARRGLDARRIGILVDFESGSVGGNPYGTGREAITIRTLPSEVPERQINIQDSEQEPSVGILNSVEYRDVSQG